MNEAGRLKPDNGPIDSGSMDSIDVWRTAHLLMKTSGGEAALIAARRADALNNQGDLKAFAVWCRVVLAIIDLERLKPDKGEKLN